MFLGLAKKGAEAAGFIEAPEPEIELVEDDEVADETAVAAPVEVSSTTVKQVGKVAPYVVDPQIEYNKMAELFGVFSSSNRRYAMVCPGCGKEDEVEAASIDMQQDCLCPECNTEDTFDGFFSHVIEDLSSSREPTTKEICLVTGRNPNDKWDLERAENIREQLRIYYGLLNGVGSLVDLKQGHINNGMHNGKWMKYCSSNCSERSCGTGCGNERMKWYGKVLSLQAVQAEQEGD